MNPIRLLNADGSATSPQAEHLVCLREAVTRSGRGGDWEHDARQRARKCMDFVASGVGFPDGAFAVEPFISTLRWDVHAHLVELFDLYVTTGAIDLSRLQPICTDPEGAPINCLPLEAGVTQGNVALVNACLKNMNPIPAVPSTEWKTPCGDRYDCFDQFVNERCIRHSYREPIKEAISSARLAIEASNNAARMTSVIDSVVALQDAVYGETPRRRRATLV